MFFPLNIGDRIHVASHLQQSNLYSSYDADPQACIGVTTHTYALKRFRDGNGVDHVVAFHSDVKNTMEALIKGYHYHRKPRRRGYR